MLRHLATCLAIALLPFTAFAGDLQAKKEALIAVMNETDCKMTTPEADVKMPELGITRPEAVAIANELLAAGQAKFGEDEETLVILPPICETE